MSSQNFNNFAHTINLVFQRWTALQICLEQSDVNPKEEMDALTQETCEFFQRFKDDVTPDDLANNFTQWMEQAYGVEVEDGSPRQVGSHCCQLYHQIVVLGDLTPLHSLQSNLDSVKQRQRQSKVQEPEEGSSESEMDDSDVEMDEAHESKPREKVEKTEKIVDDDGFELVQRRRR